MILDQYILLLDIFNINVDDSLSFHMTVSPLIIGVIVFIGLIIRLIKKKSFGENFEINEAAIGIGNNTIKVRPSYEDMQIAYQLYVELATRKIGLSIDFENDFLIEIYNSWYEFFKVTRTHIKEIPAHKIKRSRTTRTIVNVAIEVLNEGLRPHLSKWQSRFRKWYEENSASEDFKNISPQDLQKQFPDFEKLIAEMREVNKKLIEYRKTMKMLSIGNE